MEWLIILQNCNNSENVFESKNKVNTDECRNQGSAYSHKNNIQGEANLNNDRHKEM